MPPKGEAAVQGPWSAEAESQAFDSLLTQLTGTPAIPEDADDVPAIQSATAGQGRTGRPASGLPSGAGAPVRPPQR